MARFWQSPRHGAGAQSWPDAGSLSPALPARQNGMVERVIRSLKTQRIHRHRFESIGHANRVIGTGSFDRSPGPMACTASLCSPRRPHRALAMRKPVETFRSTA